MINTVPDYKSTGRHILDLVCVKFTSYINMGAPKWIGNLPLTRKAEEGVSAGRAIHS